MEVDDDNPVFTVVDKGTQRAGLMLTDSRGFSFTKKNSRKDTTYWWCSVRSKAMRCPATVIQKGQTFSDGKQPHCHPAKPGLPTAVEIVAKVKSTAKELVRDSARSVVEDVLKEVDINAPEAARPNQHTLIRMANRTREKIRPKHPQNLDFEISYPYMPEDFIQSDVRVDGERHILMATREQLSLLTTAKVWFVDGTFKIVRRPFYQLTSIHAFVRSGNSTKQVPLGFILMSRRRKADYKAVSNQLKEVVVIYTLGSSQPHTSSHMVF